MNDVVVDADGGFAYITDSGIPIDPSEAILGGIIIFNMNTEEFHRVLSGDMTTSNDPSLWITINGEHVGVKTPMHTGADGIALSCDYKTLYYTPLSSRYIYAINTNFLWEKGTPSSTLQDNIVHLGYKGSASDGLSYTSDNQLLITAIEHSAIYSQPHMSLNVLNFYYKKFVTLLNNTHTMMWPDTIGFNGKEMVFVSNQLFHFVAGQINFLYPLFGNYNFRIWGLDLGTTSYIMGCSQEENSESSFPTWAILLIVFGTLAIFALGILIYYYLHYKRLKAGKDEEQTEQILLMENNKSSN